MEGFAKSFNLNKNERLNSFLNKHSNIVNDVIDEKRIDFNKLDYEISRSKLLQKFNSLKWFIRNYDKIIAGAYRDFELTTISKPKFERTYDGYKAPLFGTEHHYTKEDFESHMTNWDDIDF